MPTDEQLEQMATQYQQDAVSPFPVNKVVPDTPFWKAATKHLQNGGRLNFAYSDYQGKDSPYLATRGYEKYLGRDWNWTHGKRGALHPDTITEEHPRGQTFDQMMQRRNLARYPGALDVNQYGEARYTTGSIPEEFAKEAELRWEYGTSELPEQLSDEDIQSIEGYGDMSAPQRVQAQINFYETATDQALKERKELSDWDKVFNTDGNKLMSAYDWANARFGGLPAVNIMSGKPIIKDDGTQATVTEVWQSTLPTFYSLFGKSHNVEDKRVAEYLNNLRTDVQDKARRQDDIVGALLPYFAEDTRYRDTLATVGSLSTQYSFKAGYASLKNLLPNWDEDIIDPRVPINDTVRYLENHPNASPAEMYKYGRDPLWGDLSDGFLNPNEMALGIALDFAGSALIKPALGVAKAGIMTKYAGREMLKYGDEIIPEVAKYVDNVDDRFLLGGMKQSDKDEILRSGILDGIEKGAKNVAERIQTTADSRSPLNWNNGSKTNIYAENVQRANRWILSALGTTTPSSDEYVTLAKAIAGLSGTPAEIDQAVRILSELPNWKWALSDSGMTASHAFREIFQADPKWVAKALKDIDEAATVGERLLTIAKKSEEFIAKHAEKRIFPDIVNQKNVGAPLRVLAQTEKQAQRILQPFKQFFSTMYLRLTPGYAVRNLANNTFQIAFDFHEVPAYLKSSDELMAWFGGADNIEYIIKHADKDVADLFVGLKRNISGASEGAVTGKAGKKGGILGRFGADTLSENWENAGSAAVFKKVVPQEMEKQLRGVISGELVEKFGIDIHDAKHFENVIIENNGNIGKAFEQIARDAERGFYKSVSMQNMPPELRTFLQEYNLDPVLRDIIATSKNTDEVVKRYSEYIVDYIDTAKRNVVQAGQQPIKTFDDTLDYINDAVTRGNLDKIASDTWVTYEVANARVNRSVRATLESHYRQMKLAVDAFTGNVDKTDDVINQIAQTIVLEPDGVMAKLGKMNGTDYLRGMFSGEVNPRVAQMIENYSNNLNRRLAEIAELSTPQEFGEYLARELPKVADELGDTVLDEKFVISKVYEDFFEGRRLFWQSWRDNNFNMAKRVMGDLSEALEKGGTVGVPKVTDEFLKKMDDAMGEARRFDNHVPRQMTENTMRGVRKMKDARSRNAQFVQLYAKQFGIDRMFLDDGMINKKRLVNIINEQLDQSFTNLYDMGSLQEQQIKEAMRASSLGEVRNTFQSVEDITQTMTKVISDPSNVTKASNRRMQDFLAVLDEIDYELSERYAKAMDIRRGLGKRAKKADIKTADELLEQLSQEVIDKFTLNIEKSEEIAQRVFKRVYEDPPPFIPEWNGINSPNPAQMIWETKDKLLSHVDEVESYVGRTFDETLKTDIAKAKDWQEKVQDMQKYTAGMVDNARVNALRTAQETRDFILHNYSDRNNIDTMVSLLAPYHFWHTRNGANWIKRIAKNPLLARKYALYKQNLYKINKDAPTYYKDRWNMQNFPIMGFMKDHPFWIDMEAFLFPLGRIGRANFPNPEGEHATSFGKLINGMDAWGISPHSIFPIALSIWHYMNGRTDVAGKLHGRGIPQTGVLKAITSKMGVNNGIGIETDPLLIFNHVMRRKSLDGALTALDTYEMNKISIELSQGIREGRYDQAEVEEMLVDVDENNPIFVEARAKAMENVSTARLLSFVGSPSFKPRTEAEMTDMKMREEFRSVFEYRDTMGTDEFQLELKRLQAKYPEYYSVSMLAMRPENERDIGYTYNIMGRMPPAQTSALEKIVGLNPSDLDDFYATKGQNLLDMNDAERWEFMAKIRDLGAILAVPDTATKQEWTAAHQASKQLEKELRGYYGDSVYDLKDAYFALTDADQRRGYLEINPELKQLMSDETMLKMQNPLLSKYYASYDGVRAMARGEMFGRLDEMFPQAKEEQAMYFSAKDRGEKVKPSEMLLAYWKEKDAMEELYGYRMLAFGDRLPDGDTVIIPKRLIEQPERLSERQQEIYGYEARSLQPEFYSWDWAQWEQKIGDPVLARLTEDWAFRGAEFSRDMRKALQAVLGDEVDIDEALPLLQSRAQEAGKQYYDAENLPWWMK